MTDKFVIDIIRTLRNFRSSDTSILKYHTNQLVPHVSFDYSKTQIKNQQGRRLTFWRVVKCGVAALDVEDATEAVSESDDEEEVSSRFFLEMLRPEASSRFFLRMLRLALR